MRIHCIPTDCIFCKQPLICVETTNGNCCNNSQCNSNFGYIIVGNRWLDAGNIAEISFIYKGILVSLVYQENGTSAVSFWKGYKILLGVDEVDWFNLDDIPAMLRKIRMLLTFA